MRRSLTSEREGRVRRDTGNYGFELTAKDHPYSFLSSSGTGSLKELRMTLGSPIENAKRLAKSSNTMQQQVHQTFERRCEKNL